MSRTSAFKTKLIGHVSECRFRLGGLLSIRHCLLAVLSLGWAMNPESSLAQVPAKDLGTSTAPDAKTGEKAVRAVLDDQLAAWNKGDIDGFLKGYWNSDKLTFISGGSITQGWEPTRQRYLKRYAADGKDKMGALAFEELQVEGFGADAAMVRGVFKLVRDGQTDFGRFTLLFRKFSEGWKIVHDHTSVGEKPMPKKSE